MSSRFGAVLSIALVCGSVSGLAKSGIVEFDPQGSISTAVGLNSIDKKGNIAGSYCCDSHEGVQA